MKNTKDELIEEYSRILTATNGKPRSMTEEEYMDFIKRREPVVSGEGAEFRPTEYDVVSGEGAELNPPESPMAPEAESPLGWPKEVKLPDGSTVLMKSPEEWRNSIKERRTNTPNDEEVLSKMTEMKNTVKELESEMSLAEINRDMENFRSMVSRLEKMVEVEEKRRKSPTVQGGEIE